MDPPPKPSSASLFQVYLRLRPPPSPLLQLTQQSLYPLLPPPERYLTVEPPTEGQNTKPTHITIHPPSDSRKRAVEKFAFTKVFEEDAGQLEIFKETGVVPLVEGVLGEGRDGLLATLGVSGSGKSHTILGSKSQRGLAQLSLDLLYRSLGDQTLHPAQIISLLASLNAADASEAQIYSASTFLDGVYGEPIQERNNSRATTPMAVGRNSTSTSRIPPSTGLYSQWSILGISSPRATLGPSGKAAVARGNEGAAEATPQTLNPYAYTPRAMRNQAKVRFGNAVQDPTFVPNVPKRHVLHRPSALPQCPNISDISIPTDQTLEFVILVSMYEVYNDRIFDLLSHPRNPKDLRRRPLLFKPTEALPDRKVVAGLRKVVCGTYEEALMVLETGLLERRVAGTGSNSVSSRSHGFFCVEVKKRPKGGMSSAWSGAQLTIVDLAGSERAKNAKTAGATLAEAGKINESLMYLGQCLQMQSDCHEGSKAIMIVTADPLGDFNATSQILRYSALAREITVPRIPSVTSTILSGNNVGALKTHTASGRTSPNTPQMDEGALEMALSEVARLNEEVEVLSVKLSGEQGRRREAEEEWQRAENRAEEIEIQIREECWQDMERRLDEERRRWLNAWGEEADRNDEHVDRKLELLSKGIQIYEDPIASNNSASELEHENEVLRRRVGVLERELQSRSPIKSAKQPHDLGHIAGTVAEDDATVTPLYEKLNRMSLKEKRVVTPGKKVRKLTARKWDLMDENEMDAYENF
ncbi:MAG: hypothetical protein Q9191_003681 [Dirinaria sp. TL-2023a]